MRICVTGKIGSGKSSFAKALASGLSASGYALVDVDGVTSQMHAQEEFLKILESATGTRDRQEASRACFANPRALEELERASRPIWLRLVDEALRKENAIVDFPLAIEEPSFLSAFDLAIGTRASDPIRKERAMARLGWEDWRFKAADARQIGQRAKMAFCDMFVDNDAGREELEAHAALAAKRIAALDRAGASLKAAFGTKAWREVCRAHIQPGRFYHDSRHLQWICEHADQEALAHPAFALAAGTHDIVYETGERHADSEALSCGALGAMARGILPELSLPHVPLALAIVDATKGHKADDPWLASTPERLGLAQAFLDADLGVLGAGSDQEFRDYCDGIAKEFSGVEDFDTKRAAFLEAMSARPEPIYATPKFKPHEARARKRLSAEAARLRAHRSLSP